MVPAGTHLTVDVQGQTGQFVPRTAADVETMVSHALTPNLDVFDIQITRGGLLNDPLRLYYWNWKYTAVVLIGTRVPYADAADAASFVASAFYNATGEMPIVSVRGYGEQQTPDVITGPSLLGFGAIAVVGLIAVAALAWKIRP